MIHATVKNDKTLNDPKVANHLLLCFMDARDRAMKSMSKCECGGDNWKKD